MATIAEIRKKYPQYSDLSDRQLADSLRTKFYSDIPEDEFLNRVGLGETSFLRDVGGAAIRGAGQIVSLPGQLTGLVTGDMDNISTRAGKAVEEYGADLQTGAFRERQRQQAERVAEAEKEGFLSGFGQQAKELLTDPLSLAAGIAQTAPAMIGTGGAGLAGRALAGRLIGQQAAKRGALAGAATGEAAIVGGDAAQATYDRVSQMPQEVVARSDAYQAAIAEGATPEEARNAAAISAARRAAAVAAPIAAATGPLGLEAALLTGGVRRGVLRGGAEGAIREGGTEVVQETGQGVAENIGAQAIDPNVALTQDLGGRAAAGLILGGTMGGGAGAISGLRGPEAEPEAEPGTEPPPPAAGPEAEPEPVVPATPFGVPPVSEKPPAGPAGPTVTIDAEEVIIEQPDGSFEVIPRAEWEATQRPAAAPVAEPVVEREPVPEAAPEAPRAPVAAAAPEPTPVAAPAPAPDNTEKRSQVGVVTFDQKSGIGQVPYNQSVDYRGFTAMMRPSKFLELAADLEAPKQSSLDYITKEISSGKPVGSPFLNIDFETGKISGHDGRHRMMVIRDLNGDQPVPVHFFGKGEQRARSLNADKIRSFASKLTNENGRPSADNFSEAFLQGATVGTAPVAPTPAPAPTPAKPPRAQKLPAPPKAATTMQAYIAQIAKTFKKGQDRYSFEKAVDAGVDPDWLNSRADLRRMFGKEKLTRGRDGKVIQNQRQINENLKDFADLAMGFQPKDWGLYGDSLDENGYVTREALADLINRDAPRYDPTTGRPYEQETQEEEDYGFEATVEAVSREASDLGVDLTDAETRAIAERIGADGDPAQGIVDYVNEKFEGLMAEARDYSEYDAGQEEFPDGPVTNIEDRTAEPGVGGQAVAPGDTGRGQTDREQPAGTAPGTQEGSLGLEAVQPVPAGGMTERQRAEMQARLQQSQMRRGNQEAFDQQEGGMFDASRDQGDLLSGRAEPEEDLDEEIDYDEHPLMVAHNQKFEDLIEALEELETPASVRKRVNKLIKDGVLDEGVVDDVNEAMDDEDPGFKTDAGRDALVEALENARDEAVTDIEEEIDQLVAEERDRLSEVRPGDIMGGVRMDIDKYRGGKLSDMLEEIFANFDNKFNQYDMYLAGRISTILSEVERAGFKVKLIILQEGETAPANVASGRAYGAVRTDLDANTIEVFLRSPSMGENSAGNTSEVVLHEALHAVSGAFILAVRKTNRGTPKIVKFVNDLNGVRNKVVEHFNRRVKSGVELNELEKSWLERTSNVFADLDEFLTWGMTNANAQEYLRGIEAGPGQNLFQRFVAMFKSMLGIPDGDTSALSRLIEIINPLFEATEADYRAIMGAPAPGKQGPAQGTLFARGAQMRGRSPPPPPSGPPPSGPQQSLFPPSQLPPSLTLPKETRLQRYSRKLVDRFERLRVVQSLGQLAAGIEGFYEAARKFDSRAGELMQKFERDFGKKIKEIAREAGFGMNDIDLYLYSKAAPEINADFEMREIGRLVTKKGGDPAIMTKINGTNPNFDMNQRERDWTPDQPRWSHPDPGIDAAILAEYKKANTTLLSGSGISNKDAFDEVDPLENGPKGQAWKDIAKVHRESVKWALDNDVARGVKSRKVADEMFKAIPHYVPVKGKTKSGQFLSDADFALMDDQGDSYEEMMSGGAGFSITKNEWNQRRGRKTLPFSPYGTFMSDIGARIVRGERNRVGQKMMDFFIRNPSNEWRVFSDRNPPRDRNGNIRRPDPRDPKFMVVKRGGETFYLLIEDPLLAKAAKNLNPTQMNAFLEFSNKVTRLLSRSFTTANPDFFVPNIFRDLQSAALNLAADAPGLAKAFSKNVRDRKAFRSIAAFEYGRPGGDPALRDLYEQFKLDGGSVSWAQRETPQEAAARIQDDLKTLDERLKDIKDAKGAKETIDALWKPTSKSFRAMVGALESTNAIFENGIRFAAYRAAIKVGMTREQAAMIAREATVDFNRRGEAGALLNALYAFFNAGIQGSVRTARALSNNPFKTGKLSSTQAALLGMMSTAAMLAAANAAMSDEDDDGKLFWDKIPDYEKERNLIIMNPVNGKSYVKIPMPYGFGFFPYLATRTMDAARRGDDLGAAGMDIVTAALGNFSPMQFSAGSVQSSIARAATPTVFKPLTELALNENFMGKPIYNEPFDRGQSYASVARFNTPEGYKELSQFLNDISGGEGKVKGSLNAPAESFEYLVEFGFGGVTQLAKSLYKTGAEGEPLAAPVVRRLVGQPGKGRNVGEYYEREEKARVVSQQLKDLTGAERRALIDKFPAETNPRVQSALTSARSAVRKLNEERKRIQNLDIDEGVKAERLEALRERTDAEFVRFNRIYNQVEQATR